MIFPVVLLLICATLLSANMLREEKFLDFNEAHGMSVYGPFPADPVYAITTWYDATCSATFGSAAILLDTCLTNKNGQSWYYTCAVTSGVPTVTLQIYSDSSCTAASPTVKHVTNCTKNAVFIESANIPTTVTINSCTGTKNTILTNVKGVDLYHGNFGTRVCNETVQAAGFFNNLCYPAVNASSHKIGIKFDWPTAYKYPNNDCTGTPSSTTLEADKCTANPASTNPIYSGAYGQFWVASSAPQNMFLGMGAVLAFMMVFLQLFKN